jgi:sporulation protein YlmC with PRC-barrel domain
MRPSEPIKLVAELLDLPIQDKEGRYCGIVDDVELSGGAGKEMRLAALLVGPGAYEGRLPAWAYWLVRKIAGDRIVRVEIGKVEQIRSVVQLNCRADAAKLHAVENRFRGWIPKKGAL